MIPRKKWGKQAWHYKTLVLIQVSSIPSTASI